MKNSICIVGFLIVALLPAGAAVNLKDSLDGNGLVWASGGTANWTGQTTTKHDGVDAAQSGFIADNQESWLETKVTGPGTLTFWWTVSSEPDYDWLRFQIDGVFQDQISGAPAWVQKTVPISSGGHTMRWRYIKDVNGSGGQDQGWLDQVDFQGASGAPTLAVQPSSQTVWAGATVRFDAVVLGEVPLVYQWYYNQTNAIPGATNSSYTVSNAVPESVGAYTLEASNGAGASTSEIARLDLTNHPPVSRALLFVDGTFGSACEIALSQLGIPYDKYTAETVFNQKVTAADAGNTLVVLDAPDLPHALPSVVDYIGRGGRVLAETYTVVSSPNLATALGVVVERRLSSPGAVYDWAGSSLLSGLPMPLRFSDYGYVEDGQRFHALPGAYAVAGSSTSPSPGQAAIVIANAGRTIVNGLLPEELATSGEAVRLAVNQIGFLTGQTAEAAPFIRVQPRDETVVPGAQTTLQVTAQGANPIVYQWFHNDIAVPGATGAVYQVTNAAYSQAGRYRATGSNAWGAVVTEEASLRVKTNGPVRHVLLFRDSAGSLGYPAAVGSFLAGKGLDYRAFSDAGKFNLALSQAGPSDTLAIVEAPQTPYGFDALAEFVRHGGRAILHYWNIQVARDLATAFGATVTETYTTMKPLYRWVNHPVLDAISSPVQFGDLNNVSGQRFKVLEGAVGLAGFTTTSNSLQVGMVLGNGGRTLLNGFFLPEMLDQATANRLVANELKFFFSPSPPIILTGLTPDKTGITLTFDTYPGLSYLIERSPDPAGPWMTDAGSLPGDGMEKTVVISIHEPREFFRVRY